MRITTHSGAGAGIGAGGYTLPTPRPSSTDIREIPGYCSWMPFSDYMDSCQPYSPQELERMTQSQIERVYRSLPPEQAIPLTEAAIDRIERDTAAGAASDPIGSCAQKAYLENPTMVKLLGPEAYCSPEGEYTAATNWLLYGALAFGGLMLVMSLRR